MNLSIYYPKIRVTTNGALSGKNDHFVDHASGWFNQVPTVKVWLEDDDLQQLEVCSSNIGFVYTFRKFYASQEKEIRELQKEVEEKGNENS